MRLEVPQRGPREFYDELMYIVSNRGKYISHPGKKVRLQSKTLTGYSALTALVILVFLFEYHVDRGGIFLLLSGMMLVCLIYFIALIVGIRKRINLMMSEPGTKFIDIDEKGVRFESSNQNLKTRWDEILYVIINKHSIVFMPKAETQLMISIYSEYREQVLKAIEDAGHMDIVIDNTSKN